MNEKDFTAKIREILDNESVTMDTVLADVEEWDSLSIVSFAAFANSSCGKRLAPALIRDCVSIRDLYNLLQAE
ncbi:MAG: hypothetical protein IJT02_03140 [Synergistaceae bacterium]|nr:hypothetical protein [Synergistaceae bacterium]